MKLASLTNQAMIKVVFWSHMAVAAFSHVAVVMMVAGAFNLVLTSEVGFLTKGMLFGLLFFSGMYGVNHVTNQDDGFCYLTHLENFYRSKEGMPRVGPFMPRFYATVKQLFKRTK